MPYFAINRCEGAKGKRSQGSEVQREEERREKEAKTPLNHDCN